MAVNYFKKLRDGYVSNQVKHIKLDYFEPSSTVRKSIIFSGRVQKVGFRLEIYEIAKRMNLTGWVKNRIDKNVEAEIQGENDKIIFLINYMKSLKRASVQNIEINEMMIVDGESEFTVIRK
ncbi:acylphosphatase [Clostridium lacusfryxellense]|uniref:acylphosphatase n=1 Tax=Clostridium lacusfryxellense TaxID=205328 RepID=UPI001C0C9293|nr:acylphosphatase [Clostridium lacusfryxellense]MBU3114280.1 acylphosphatase [Clostridium lacusfryxellense]